MDQDIFQDMDLNKFSWIFPPQKYQMIYDLKQESIEGLQFTIEPGTDFWQRTYYGFQNDNAHSFITQLKGDFTFSVRTEYSGCTLFDQCGVVMYQNSDNWVKASIEFENNEIAKLGSVVTNLGYSDWATTDIQSKDIKIMWYRLSRRGQDFLIETSEDGIIYQQLRIFHMHAEIETAQVGIYACAPLKSTFEASFREFKISPCQWKAHEAPKQD